MERVTYRNEENGYSVIRCRVSGFSDPVTAVGTMPDVHVGAVLAMSGTWRVDARYGRQFSIETFEETLPATAYGIEKYLGSGLVKGIGPQFARRIVRAFGADTLAVIEERPEALLDVPGIGKQRVEMIKRSWQEQREIKNIMLFLQGHDVSTAHATRIFKQYGPSSIDVVRENPYRLADDIWGIGFKTADQIAQKLGFGKDDPFRLRSGLKYTLNCLSEEGHCYEERDRLLEAGAKLLDADPSLLESALDQMILKDDVIAVRIPDAEAAAVYLPVFFHAERVTAARLKKIFETPPARPVPPTAGGGAGIAYDEKQLEAIRAAVTQKMMILTGGPGTGKSTTTLGIIRALRGLRILLAAPTGRAAKRLSEVTGLEAKTIHRLLEFKPAEGYKRNENTPLEGDALIVDESSMTDVLLMSALLKAVPNTMRVILVGDADQLPSVGAGNVLRDIIRSGAFPVITLTKIFRQAAASRIITNAHRIDRGEYPDLTNAKGTDFFFRAAEDPDRAAQIIVDLVRERLPKYYGIAPGLIQVLTPMQRGAVGAVNLNQLLQAAVNPSRGDGKELRRGGSVFRVGDKVMQIRNDYDKEVFNGDIGTVLDIDPEARAMTVLFDGRQVGYDVSELDEIVLAYATTVHKAQGAEFPVVVMPVMMTHYVMLQRNLLYTGVTRAKKALVLVGEKKAVALCVRNVTADRRNTLLKERLMGKRIEKAEIPEASALPITAPAPAGGRYICFDVETPNALNDRMSAIGISVVEDGKITREFFSYVDPEEPFDAFNTELTGISAGTVADAPTFGELWPRIRGLMESGTLVAHNAPFDLGVLKKCLRDYGAPFKERVPALCTVRIGRRVLPGISHKLNDMCSYYGIALDHHQADSDSRACAEILIRYMRAGVRVDEYQSVWRMV